MKTSVLIRFLLVPISFLFVSPVRADDYSYARPYEQLSIRSFISGDNTPYLRVLTPYPAPGSPASNADWAEVYALQKSRTPAECQLADSESNPTPGAFFRDPTFNFLSAADRGALNAFALRVFADAGSVASALKQVDVRERPFNQSSDVHPCISRPGGKSYPSGHATMGTTLAYALTDVFASQPAGLREAILQRGELFGHNRILGGVHFPSDVAMGQLEAQIIVGEMRKSTAYRNSVSALQRTFAPKFRR